MKTRSPRKTAGPAFSPPPGASIIYESRFAPGSPDGWTGRTTTAKRLPDSRASLLAGGGRKCASRSINLHLAGETVLSFHLYTEDCPRIFVQCFNKTAGVNCKSFWDIHPNRDYGRWVHVWWPLTGTLVDCATNHERVTQSGDVLSSIQVHPYPKTTVWLDRIVIYSLDGRGKVAQAAAALRKLARAIKALPARQPALKSPCRRWAERARQLGESATRLAAREDLPFAEGKAFCEEVMALSGLVDRCRRLYAKTARAFGSGCDYAVGTENPMVRISDLHWRYPFSGEVTGEVGISSARNEYASFQAVVLPLRKDLRGVKVGFSDLRRLGGGGRISAANCTWHAQPYVQPLPCYAYPGTDWLAPKPDPLLPGRAFDLPETRYAPLWITVHTPRGTPAGDYEGALTVSPANARRQKVKVRLHVWDFELPVRGRFRCQTSFNVENVEKFYRRRLTGRWRRQWYDFLLRYRFSPTQQYRQTFSPHPDDVEFCKRRGCNVWILAGLSGRDEVPLAALRRRYNIARRAGILPYCHVYIGDETNRFALMQRKANLIHANFPGLKVMIGGSRPRKEFIGYIDIWDPTMAANPLYGFDPAELTEAQRRGEEVMWYTAASPQHPYPNVHMGDPLFASRLLFWLTWKYGITGFEYYCFAIWGKNPTVRPRWPESSWHCYSWDHTNGDGQLCYPGPQGRPAASIRLENIRAGIQDWEALYMLQGAAACIEEQIAAGRISSTAAADDAAPRLSAGTLLRRARAALAIDDDFCKDVTHWAMDPEGLSRRRDEVSRLLQAAIAIVGHEEFESYQAGRLADRHALERRRLDENHRRALRELNQAP